MKKIRHASIIQDKFGIQLNSGYEERDSTLTLDSLDDVYDIINACNTFVENYEHDNGLDEEDGY